MDIRRMVSNRSGRAREQAVVRGVVSSQKPAPTSATDPVWVLMPSHTTTASIPISIPASFPTVALPQQGDTLVIGFDERGTPYIIGWEAS